MTKSAVTSPSWGGARLIEGSAHRRQPVTRWTRRPPTQGGGQAHPRAGIERRKGGDGGRGWAGRGPAAPRAIRWDRRRRPRGLESSRHPRELQARAPPRPEPPLPPRRSPPARGWALPPARYQCTKITGGLGNLYVGGGPATSRGSASFPQNPPARDGRPAKHGATKRSAMRLKHAEGGVGGKRRVSL